jgi:hypothetical protein
VILAGGAFNTPQLMLSASTESRSKEIRINASSFARVGANLQDRYEVAMIAKYTNSLWRAELRFADDLQTRRSISGMRKMAAAFTPATAPFLES